MKRAAVVVLLLALAGCRWKELVWQPDFVWQCTRWLTIPVEVNGVPVEPWRVSCLDSIVTRKVDTIPAPPIPVIP